MQATSCTTSGCRTTTMRSSRAFASTTAGSGWAASTNRRSPSWISESVHSLSMGVLDKIAGPHDLRGLSDKELETLASEIRDRLITSCAPVGGHLGPNLGVVELTMAIHRVFDSPRDRVVWDTGHQAYVHKLVTGRVAEFGTLRREGGMSGYPSQTESEHDIVENSHASTALSYADGLAKAYAVR